MPSFTCPKCKKTLKTAAPIPAGKSIKCPACGRIDITGQRIQQLVAAIKDTERNYPDLARNLRFKLD